MNRSEIKINGSKEAGFEKHYFTDVEILVTPMTPYLLSVSPSSSVKLSCRHK